MKKVLFIVAILLLTTTSIFANEGKLKAGVILGYPTGLTAGWRPSDAFELNFIVASHYRDFTIGLSPMFTIATPDIEGERFPISVGPAVYLDIDWFGGLDLDILGQVRMEYTFRDIPLNLFIEGGLGVKLDFDGVRLLYFHGSGALGIRYVF